MEHNKPPPYWGIESYTLTVVLLDIARAHARMLKAALAEKAAELAEQAEQAGEDDKREDDTFLRDALNDD